MGRLLHTRRPLRRIRHDRRLSANGHAGHHNPDRQSLRHGTDGTFPGQHDKQARPASGQIGVPMTSQELAAVLRVVPETKRQLITEGTLSSAIDTIYAGEAWMKACIAAISQAPGWLRQQVGDHEDDALVPNLVADAKGPQARAVFLSQSAAAAAAGAWADGDALACLELARRAALWWSVVDGLDYHPPTRPPIPLATLADSLQVERADHDPRAWAPVEDMVLSAAAGTPGGRSATERTATQTWTEEPTGAVPAKLVLEIVADAPPGLWRAAQAGLTLVDGPFLAALQDAWTWATTRGGLSTSSSVRWRLLRADETRASKGSGDAIGLACAVGLQQLATRHHRLHRLDGRTGYLAAVSADGRTRVPVCKVSPADPGHLRRMVVARAETAPAAQLALRRADSVNDAIAHGRRPVKARLARSAAVACALAIAITIAGVAAIRSNQSDSRARAAAAVHTRQAEAAALANEAQALISTDPPRAIVAAAAAYRLAPNDPAVTDAVIAASGSDPRALRYLSPAAKVTQLSLSANGNLLAALLANGKIEVWSLATTHPKVLTIRQPPGVTSAIGFSGGGPSLIAAGTAITVTDPLTGASRRLGKDGPTIDALSAGPVSHMFATASSAGVRLWNSTTGTSHALSNIAASTISLAPNGRTVLVGAESGTLRLLHADGGIAASTKLPAPVTSVLLAPSGTAYATTSAGRVYCLNARLRPVRKAIKVPADDRLSLRPGANVTELTPSGPVAGHRPAQIALTAFNAALMFPDAPADMTTGTRNNTSFNTVAIPIRGLGTSLLATDGNGNLIATVLTDGQIRISTIDLTNGPPLQVQDVAAGGIIGPSTLAITTGLLHVPALTALVNRTTGQVTALASFSHAADFTVRPVITAHEIVDTGSTTSSLDVWRIRGNRLSTLAQDMTVAPTAVSGISADDNANLLFVADNTQLQVRRLTIPARQITQTSLKGRIVCLRTDPLHHTLYACTTEGIIAFTYAADGRLGAPRTVDTATAQGLVILPGNKILVMLPDGDATLLPRGFSSQEEISTTLTTGDSTTLSSALTPTTAIISGLSFDLLLYSTATDSQLAGIQLGGGEFVTTLWHSSVGTISGSTLDGYLFTLPSTLPAFAVHQSCALLANPRSEWQADFGHTQAATLLPAAGGC
jgi:WD40 repeat protein